MNILFLTRFYPEPKIGGIERVTKLLAEFFVRKGHRVFNLYFEQSRYDGCFGELFEAKHLEDIYDRSGIADYLKSHQISIVINQSQFFYSPFLGSVVHEMGAKLITCIHSSISMKTIEKSDALKSASGLKKTFIQWGYPLFKCYSENKLRRQHINSFNASDRTLLLSDSLVDQFRKNLRLKKTDNRLDFIYNPLSFPERMEEVSLLKKENIVLVVARLYEPQKKLSLLFQAWSLIPTDGWELIIVGDGTDRPKYEEMAKGMNNVLFVGTQNPISYYRRARIFAMTSIWEGLPMSILECLQMGVVPIVMDSFLAAKDLIDDGENGVLVPYPNTKTFANELSSLMRDKDKRETMVRNAIESSKRYSMDEIGRKWECTFDSIL